jgi:hypothetical protein
MDSVQSIFSVDCWIVTGAFVNKGIDISGEPVDTRFVFVIDMFWQIPIEVALQSIPELPLASII